MSGMFARFNVSGLKVGTLTVCALMSLSIACSEKKAEPAAAPAAGNSLKNAMSPMAPGGAAGAPPAGSAPAAGGPSAGSPEGFVSPECKALEEEQATVRKEVERINTEIVAPAAERAEAAYSEYQSCQDDAGCLSDLARFQARQSALASTRRAQEQAESQVEGLETRLHDISQKLDAKCNTDPL